MKGDDGKWRISWAQVSEVYRDAEGKEFSRKWKWRWGPGVLAKAMSVTLIKLDSAAEPSQDTPENAALSIFSSLHVAEKRFKMNSAAAMYGELLRVVEPLATSKFWESAKAGGAAWADEVKKMSEAATKVAGTEPSTEGKNGSKVVKFKKSETWRADVQAEVREVEGKWVIVDAGVWENVGGIDKGPQYRAVPDIYKLPRP